jgi:effector-binding domain-containing protein
MNEVTVVQVNPQRVLGMRKRGTYAEIGPMIVRVYKYAVTQKAGIVGRPIFVCHETPRQAMKANEESNADVEVAIPVARQVEGTGDVICHELAGGSMARIVHKGPHETCAPTYRQLFAWIAEQHKKITGPTREVYLNDPRRVPPEEILTEIYAPIA